MSLSYPLVSKCQRIKLGESDEQEHKSQAHSEASNVPPVMDLMNETTTAKKSEQNLASIPYSTDCKILRVATYYYDKLP